MSLKVKIQNDISVYHGETLGDGVFSGLACVFANDLQPRAFNPDRLLKSNADEAVSESLVQTGASIGVHAAIGFWAIVGAGAVVTRDVSGHWPVCGNPARLHDFVCPCGEKLQKVDHQPLEGDSLWMVCPQCHARVGLSKERL